MAKYQVGSSTYEVPDGIPQEQLTAILTELANRERTASGATKQATAQKDSSVLRPIKDFAIGAADTLSLGTSDEIFGAGKAAVQKLMGNEKSFSDLRNQGTAEARQALADSGAAGTVGQIAGGFIPIVRGAQLARQGLTRLGINATAPRVGAVVGGTTAGAYGAGSAEGGLTDRAVEGAMAVPLGVAFGAAAPVVADKAIKAGGAVVDRAKGALGINTPVEKLSPAAQQVLRQSDEAVTAVSPRAAKALEALSENPASVASDLRVRDLFLAEKARVVASDPQRALPDDVVFKNVGDKLKRTANQTVDSLVKAGDIDAASAKEVKAVISRAARHNRAITGELKDEALAAELARGFRTDDSIIDALNLPRAAKDAVKNAIKDLDTVTFNSLKKNQGGIFQNIGAMAGGQLGSVAGTPGSVAGRNLGGATGRLVDRVLLQQGTAPVLKRSVDRIAAGLDEAGLKLGDTVGDLEAIAARSGEKLAKQASAKASATAKMEEIRNAQNIALARARAPYAEGSKLGPNASPQAVLVEAFEDATGIKHKPGMVQDVLKSIKKDANFGPAFSTEVDQAIKALGNKPGRIDNLTNLVRAVRAKAAEQQAEGTLKIRAGRTAEQGAGRVRNAERYNAKVIENTIRDIMSKGE